MSNNQDQAVLPTVNPIVVQVVLGEGQAQQQEIETQVIQPKVAHVEGDQAPLNTVDTSALNPSETTLSLANLTAGIAGMIISAPGALLERVSPVLAPNLSKAGNLASTHASNALDAANDKYQAAASTVAQTTRDVGQARVEGVQNVAQTGIDSAHNVAQGSANVDSSAVDSAANAASKLPSTIPEAQQKAQGIVQDIVSYLPSGIQSLLPSGIVGTPSTLRTNASPLAQYTTPVIDTASNISAATQQTATDSTDISNAASRTANDVARSAGNVFDATTRKAGEVSDATSRKAGEVSQGIQNVAGTVEDSAQDTAFQAQSSIHNAAAKTANATTPQSTGIVPSSKLESGIDDVGRDSNRSNVVGTSSFAADAQRVDLDRHRENAIANTYISDSKVQQAKDALSNSAFESSAGSTGAQFSATVDSSKTSTFGLTDAGRQSATDKVSAAQKPDSQKSYTESASDLVAEKADAAASYLQRDSNKSYGQRVTDTFDSSNKN